MTLGPPLILRNQGLSRRMRADELGKGACVEHTEVDDWGSFWPYW